jgi:hypothetical protein
MNELRTEFDFTDIRDLTLNGPEEMQTVGSLEWGTPAESSEQSLPADPGSPKYPARHAKREPAIDASVLNDVPLFSGLSRRGRKVVAQHADEVRIPEGEEFVSEGSLAYEMYVMLEGSADVFRGDTKVSEMGPGDVIGEIGVLVTHKRMATVVATSPIRAIVMYGPELTALESRMPEVFDELKALIAERL